MDDKRETKRTVLQNGNSFISKRSYTASSTSTSSTSRLQYSFQTSTSNTIPTPKPLNPLIVQYRTPTRPITTNPLNDQYRTPSKPIAINPLNDQYRTPSKPITTNSINYRIPAKSISIHTAISSTRPVTAFTNTNPFQTEFSSHPTTSKPAFLPFQSNVVVKKSVFGNNSFGNIGPRPTLPRKPKKGYVVVFNHEQFSGNTKSRIGTQKDVERISKEFKKYNFTVDLFKDLRLDEIRRKMDKLSKKTLTEYSIMIVFILTHGSNNDILSAKDTNYDLNECIIDPIVRNKTLKDKPKVFIISACRGSEDPSKIETDNKTMSAPLTDTLKVFSTYRGFSSFRNTETGTYFIQSFLDVLETDVRKSNLPEMISKVTKQLSSQRDIYQVPTSESTLTNQNINLHEYLK